MTGIVILANGGRVMIFGIEEEIEKPKAEIENEALLEAEFPELVTSILPVVEKKGKNCQGGFQVKFSFGEEKA